jgi:hypothetical protein
MRTHLTVLSVMLLTICGLASAASAAPGIAPEPGTILLAASGLTVAGFVTWHRRK